MQKIKQRRYRAETWQKILGRFEESGLTVPVFCAREGISTQSLSRWRSRLGGESDDALVSKAAQLTRKTGDFIDLGNLRASDSRFEVRLELGAGVILSIARG
jgi:transposase-like protein